MEFSDIIKLLGGIGGISVIITAATIYYSKQSVERAIGFISKQNKDSYERTNKSIDDIDTKTSLAVNELKTAFNLNSQNTREDYTRLITHIDERIDKIYSKMESNTQELKEYVANEVSSLKAKDYDQDVKIEYTKDKLHGISESLLKFKLEASEKYVRREIQN